VVLNDDTRAEMMRPGSCGGTGNFGMRCSGEIVRTVGNLERTPNALRARDANVVEFKTSHNSDWFSAFQVSAADRAASLESWHGKGQPDPDGSPTRLHVGVVVPPSVFDVADTAVTVFSGYHFSNDRMAQCQVKWSTTAPLHPDPSDEQWGATTDAVPTRSTLMVRACVRWGYSNSVHLWNDTRTDPPTAQYFSGFSEGDCNSWVLAGSEVPHSSGAGYCSVAGPNVSGVVPTVAQRAELYTRLKAIPELITARPFAKLLRTAFHDVRSRERAPRPP